MTYWPVYCTSQIRADFPNVPYLISGWFRIMYARRYIVCGVLISTREKKAPALSESAVHKYLNCAHYLYLLPPEKLYFKVSLS